VYENKIPIKLKMTNCLTNVLFITEKAPFIHDDKLYSCGRLIPVYQTFGGLIPVIKTENTTFLFDVNNAK